VTLTASPPQRRQQRKPGGQQGAERDEEDDERNRNADGRRPAWPRSTRAVGAATDVCDQACLLRALRSGYERGETVGV
jgi:hypothetical protein